MKRLKQLNYFDFLMYTLLVILLLFSYRSLLILDPITNYDDTLLLPRIKNLFSINDYIYRIINGIIYDLQPVRDLSYLIDLKLKNYISFHSFHLTNLIFWVFACYFFKKLLEKISNTPLEDRWFIWGFVFFYAFSPVSTSSVAWISGRKHILSTFFILWATLVFINNQIKPFNLKSSLAIFFLYVLAILSQPINVLWPCFVLVYSYLNKTLSQRKLLLIVLFFTSALVLLANYYYYETTYKTITSGLGKYDLNFGAGFSLLAIGRYFYLCLFPFDALPPSHYQGSWQNLTGLALLVLFLYYCYKKYKSDPLIISYIAYFFIPLFPVTVKITRIFCSDTYLLNASVGIYFILFIFIKKIKSLWFKLFLSFYLVFTFIYNLDYITVFNSTETIWAYSYKKEPTATSTLNLALLMLGKNNIYKGQQLVNQLEILDPKNIFIEQLNIDLVAKDKNISSMEKINQLEKIKSNKPDLFFNLAILYASCNNTKNFISNVQKLFSTKRVYLENTFIPIEYQQAQIKIFCERLNQANECKKLHDLYSTIAPTSIWDKKNFEQNYYELKNIATPDCTK